MPALQIHRIPCLTLHAVMCVASGFAFDILGSGRIKNATGLSRLLGGRKEENTGDGGRPTTGAK